MFRSPLQFSISSAYRTAIRLEEPETANWRDLDKCRSADGRSQMLEMFQRVRQRYIEVATQFKLPIRLPTGAAAQMISNKKSNLSTALIFKE